jgi:hypothetical protein
MDPIDPARERVRPDSVTRRRVLRGLAIALAIAMGAAYWIWTGTAERRAAAGLDPEQRVALRDGALQALGSACARFDPSLDAYCDAQARVLLELPECDSACREVAQRQIARGRPTR